MVSKPNFFIDTNIIIDYLFLEEILEDPKKDEFILYDLYKPSIDLLKIIFENKAKIRSCTSFLNLCEIPKVLIENLVMAKMYSKGVPFNYFNKYRSKFLKDKKAQNEIRKLIRNYYNSITRNKLWFMKPISLPIKNLKEFKEIDKLRIKFGLALIDALIFFHAKTEKGYFVTRDSDFLENKELKNAYKKIKIVHPKEAIEIINKKFLIPKKRKKKK